MSRVGVHKDNEIIGEACVFHSAVAITCRDGLRSFQHPIYLGKVDVAQQGGDHPALRNAALA